MCVVERQDAHYVSSTGIGEGWKRIKSESTKMAALNAHQNEEFSMRVKRDFLLIHGRGLNTLNCRVENFRLKVFDEISEGLKESPGIVFVCNDARKAFGGAFEPRDVQHKH